MSVNLNDTAVIARTKSSRHHDRTREIYEEVARIDEELQRDGHVVDSNATPTGSVHSGTIDRLERLVASAVFLI